MSSRIFKQIDCGTFFISRTYTSSLFVCFWIFKNLKKIIGPYFYFFAEEWEVNFLTVLKKPFPRYNWMISITPWCTTFFFTKATKRLDNQMVVVVRRHTRYRPYTRIASSYFTWVELWNIINIIIFAYIFHTFARC